WRVGGPVQGPLAHDAAERVLAPPGLGHLSDRSDRDQAHRRARRRQDHVGLGLPASRRRVAGLPRVHPEGARSPARGRAQEDRLRERREALRLQAVMKVLRGGTLIDGTGAAPVRDVAIVIRDAKVETVTTSGVTTWPKDAEVIDVSGKTVLPGLIDC